MLILAAALTASLTMEAARAAVTTTPAQKAGAKVTCGIKTVGYRFRGVPGQQFRYANGAYAVPASGSIELEANSREATYVLAGRSISISQSQADDFGIRDVILPRQISPELLNSDQTYPIQSGSSAAEGVSR